MLTVAGQEVPSADGVAVRASLLATYRIVDAHKAMLGSSSYSTALHGYLQLALRMVVASHSTEELMTDRGALDAELLAASREFVSAIGIELESVAIRDLGLSADLKRAFADVIKARQEGLAALERARGETAALRNLANAAQSLERNPALYQLRLLHAVGQQSGARIVLNVPSVDGAAPTAEPS
jgi:regulator of protease activity HflC (stomatin/prohibitin superfamily)